MINGGAGTDVLNLALTASNTGLATVIGVETINATATSFTDLTYSMTNASLVGTTINLKNAQVGGATGFTLTNVGTGATVAADASVTGTLAVTTAAATAQTLTLAANSAATQTVTLTGSTSGTTDTATVKAAGSVTLDTDGSSQAVETVTLEGNGAAVTYTLGTIAAVGKYAFAGDQAVTLKGADTDFTGSTITNTSTAAATLVVDGSSTLATTLDLSKVAASVDIKIADAVNASNTLLTMGNNDTVTLTADVLTTAGSLTLALNDQTSTAVTNGTATVVLEKAQANGTLALDTSGTDKFSTLNIINSTEAQTALQVAAGTANTVNISGSKAVTLHASSTAKEVNAASLTAALVATTSSTLLKVTGGTGNDTINLHSAGAVTVDGTSGNDTVVVATSGAATFDLTAATLNNIDVISAKSGTSASNVTTISMKASQLSGKSYVVTGDGSDVLSIGADGSIDTPTIDLSKLTVNAANVSVVVDGTKVSSAYGTSTALTITGSNANDTITGGQGTDTIVDAAGTNTINGGAGADNITLGSGTDTVKIAITDSVTAATSYTGTNADSISGFTTTTDKLQLDIKESGATASEIDDAGLFTIAAGLSGTNTVAGSGTNISAITTAATSGTAYLTASTTLTSLAAFNLSAVITTDGTAADLVTKIQNGATSATAIGSSNAFTGFIITDTAAGSTQVWYHADAGTSGSLDAADLTLVATLTGVTTVAAADFQFI